jgi:hypothetical protein
MLSQSPSPDSSENPGVLKWIFSWQKRATEGSSFYVLEKTISKRKG